MVNRNSTVILARVSSKSQEDEGYSLDSQLKLLQGYCQQNGLKVVKVYKIAETASKEQSRKIFAELLTYLRKNDIYNLAVEKTDRLTRNLKDAVAIDDWLNENADRMLHAVKEGLKVYKEARSDVKFMWNIHLAVAKKYTDNLREEAMKGWAEKLAQGHMPSRPPIGYMTAIRNGKRIHVPNPKTATIIKKAFELYLEPSESTATIHSYLKQAGITTYNGHPISKSQAHVLLLNPYYMGVICFNGGTYAGAHKPLISKYLYKAVQKKLHGGRSVKQRRHDVTLSNVIKCGYCGKLITWQSQKGHLYGSCQRDLPTCKVNKFLREDIVQDLLNVYMEELICPTPQILKWITNRLKNEYTENQNTAEEYKKSLNERINRLHRMEEMLYDDKLAGEITKDRYEAKKADINNQLESLSDELLIADATVDTKHQEAIDLIELTQSAKSMYFDQNLDNDQKRSILTKLFDSITYKDNALSVKYSFFANSIFEKNQKTKQIMKGEKMLNQTTKNDPIYRGQKLKNLEKNLYCPIWQG